MQAFLGRRIVRDFRLDRDLPEALGITFSYVGRVFRSTGYKENFAVDACFNEYITQLDKAPMLSHIKAAANDDAEMPSVAKYNKLQYLPWNDRAWAFAVSALWTHFGNIMRDSEEISLDSAWIEAEKQTSPGFPWSLRFQTKDMFYTHGGRNVVELFYDGLEEATSWVPVWTSSVKSEVLPTRKVIANTLRTFCASAMEHSLCTSMVCNDQNAKFYAAGKAGEVWSIVGTSKYYRGWNAMAKRFLANCRTHGIALDFKEYDSSLSVAVLLEVFYLRSQCLKDPRSRKRLATLYRDIIKSTIVLGDGTLVLKSTGNPSGSQNTTPDNTLAQYLVTVFCIALQMERRGLEFTYSELHEIVAAGMYGDDHLLMGTREFWAWFSVEEFAADCLHMGMTVAPPDGVWHPRPLSDLTILSQKFLYVPTFRLWVAQPDSSKIFSSMMCGGTSTDVRMSILRASALFTEAYWQPEVSELLWEYITWALRTKADKCVDGPVTADITWQDIKSCLRSRSQTQSLWVGNLENMEQHDWRSAQRL